MARPAIPCLFGELLGSGFGDLPSPVRRLHEAGDGAVFRGHATVRRATGLGYVAGLLTSLPPAKTSAPLQVTIRKDSQTEEWQRDFDGHRMDSRLSGSHGLLSERLGLLRFSIALAIDDGSITWTVAQVSLLGISLPTRWFTGVTAKEHARGNLYCFSVRADLPGLGLVIEYAGELHVD